MRLSKSIAEKGFVRYFRLKIIPVIVEITMHLEADVLRTKKVKFGSDTEA